MDEDGAMVFLRGYGYLRPALSDRQIADPSEDRCWPIPSATAGILSGVTTSMNQISSELCTHSEPRLQDFFDHAAGRTWPRKAQPESRR